MNLVYNILNTKCAHFLSTAMVQQLSTSAQKVKPAPVQPSLLRDLHKS
ncbi:unnamed protein product [Ixodes pacificus]